MVWTTLWFKHHEEKWESHGKTYSKPGPKAYAAKQRDVWKRFREMAEERFEGYMASNDLA